MWWNIVCPQLFKSNSKPIVSNAFIHQELHIPESRARIRAETNDMEAQWAPFKVVVPELIDAKVLFKTLVDNERVRRRESRVNLRADKKVQ